MLSCCETGCDPLERTEQWKGRERASPRLARYRSPTSRGPQSTERSVNGPRLHTREMWVVATQDAAREIRCSSCTARWCRKARRPDARGRPHEASWWNRGVYRGDATVAKEASRRQTRGESCRTAGRAPWSAAGEADLPSSTSRKERRMRGGPRKLEPVRNKSATATRLAWCSKTGAQKSRSTWS